MADQPDTKATQPDVTVESILEIMKRDLDWRGPGGRPQGVITMPRAHALLLHEGVTLLLDNYNKLRTVREAYERAEATGLQYRNFRDGAR